jgi:hypothetical protein
MAMLSVASVRICHQDRWRSVTLRSFRGSIVSGDSRADVRDGSRDGSPARGLLGLRWDDIDFNGGTLAVRNSLQRVTRQLAYAHLTRGMQQGAADKMDAYDGRTSFTFSWKHR